jgi:GNAT superfamily N-acetyltransferase
MSRSRPEQPHWFLPLIAVDPFVRGNGIGSVLMAYGLAACDRGGVPVYLDSTHPRNIPLYERFGFKLVRTIEIGGHPPVYPMPRRAR